MRDSERSRNEEKRLLSSELQKVKNVVTEKGVKSSLKDCRTVWGAWKSLSAKARRQTEKADRLRLKLQLSHQQEIFRILVMGHTFNLH